jgi:hypothetical protein
MNTKHTALAVLLAISLGGNLAASAKTHKTAEEAGTKTEQKVSTSETGKSSTKAEHKKKAHEKKAKAEATSGGAGNTETKAETQKSNPLYRLFAPKTETEKTTTSNRAAGGANHEGQVYVHGYTTKTGKHVEGYWRKKPGQG